jgi:hypothetical protein
MSSPGLTISSSVLKIAKANKIKPTSAANERTTADTEVQEHYGARLGDEESCEGNRERRML